MLVFLVLSRYWYRKFSQTYSATSRFNPHRETDKTFSPNYSSSQITHVEAEAIDFLRFRFHRKRTASDSSFRFHIPALKGLGTQLNIWLQFWEGTYRSNSEINVVRCSRKIGQMPCKSIFFFSQISSMPEKQPTSQFPFDASIILF